MRRFIPWHVGYGGGIAKDSSADNNHLRDVVTRGPTLFPIFRHSDTFRDAPPSPEQCFHAVLHSSERSFWKEWVERAEGGQRPEIHSQGLRRCQRWTLLFLPPHKLGRLFHRK
ncbi:hypothetical protein CDAR_100501 [Caerostris darwini]|uniref:Uncharacterized protein n=1 Tax=Caerostris darwini TaxID=1538125 RepID=A0AAV4X1M6_9ARAC|nr:hypothetical protein CDAR_100501 [Caerostris darwini]